MNTSGDNKRIRYTSAKLCTFLSIDENVCSIGPQINITYGNFGLPDFLVFDCLFHCVWVFCLHCNIMVPGNTEN